MPLDPSKHMQRLRALFVTERFDAPYRYRCQQACEQLREEGAIANVLHVDAPELPEAVARYGVLVLFRLPWSRRVSAIVEAARRSGVRVLFDIDDLTFASELESLVPFRKRYTADEWAAAYGEPMKRLRQTLEACDAFVGSTPELSEHAGRLGKPAFVHPNVVPPYYLSLGRRLAPLRDFAAHRPLIGYFSGSDTHDEDFASIAGAVESVLRKHPSARLLVVGYLDAASRSGLLAERTVHLPYMHWRDFAAAHAACRVTLAPLSVSNAFTASKSALKYFEAGAFGTPVIASPVREMARAIRHGRNGFLAATEGEWEKALDAALDPGVSKGVGAEARRDVQAHHSYTAVRGDLRKILERFSWQGAGKAPDLTPLDMPGEGGTPRRLAAATRPFLAARDSARIALTVLSPFEPGVPHDVIETLVDRLLTDPSAREDPSLRGALVYTASDLERFAANAQIGGRGDLCGELESMGSDPSLESSPLLLDAPEVRYVALRIRARAEGPIARAQLFASGPTGRSYSEKSSLVVAYPADGVTSTHVVDLRRSGVSRKKWSSLRRGQRIRIDPMDRSGSFRVEGLVLLPSSIPHLAPPAGDSGATKALLAGRAYSREALQRAVGALRPGEVLRAQIPLPPAEARVELRQSLADESVTVDSIVTHTHAETTAFVRRGIASRNPDVDIVVPVWNRRELVLRCVTSVLRHATGSFRLVVVNDASTEAEMAPALAELARADERVIVLTNSTNLGFLGTANRGISHASGRDVLLLNSDTEVFEGFLDGLRRAAYSAPNVGLVSPLSNNATICSVPDFCMANALPEGIAASDVARIARRSSRRRCPDLVTPHGFCLYLRADCLAEIGVFDGDRFGRGFGEENDLGERAKASGFRIVLADDVYVWHEGKASFGDEGRALEEAHAAVLEARHPGYHRAVARFVEANPLFPIQEAVRRHLARHTHATAPAPLFILHASPFSPTPGGVEHHVRDLVRALALPRAVLLYPVESSIEIAEVLGGNVETPLLYRIRLETRPERFCQEHDEALAVLAEALDLFHIGWVHVHHLMFLPLAAGRLLRERGVPYLLTVHDFYPACPGFNLLDLSDFSACCPSSCGDPARMKRCQRALFAGLGEAPPPDPLAFRDRHRELFQSLLDGADAVLFPSESARDLLFCLLTLGPGKTHVIPHAHAPNEEAASREALRIPAPIAKASGLRREPLRVALVGQVAYPTKGAAAYLETISLAAHEDIEWHVFGQTNLFDFEPKLDGIRPRARVVLHGPYDRGSIVPSLRRAGIDVGLLLPAWPETFSYTLSELLAAGLPIVARRIGAVGERLTPHGCALLVEHPEEAARALGRLARDPALLGQLTSAVPPPDSAHAWLDAHRKLHDACALRAARSSVASPREGDYARLEAIAAPSPGSEAARSLVVRPDPRVSATWWFRYAEALKPLAPESLKRIVRKRLARDHARVVQTFRLPGRHATLERELTLERRYLGTARLVSHGTDPAILVHVAPFDPELVTLVRFDLWCSTRADASAQLYWKHRGQDQFGEDRSVTIPLHGASGEWHEYSARLDVGKAAHAWLTGGPIVALRFDPIDVPGPLLVGVLSLCTTDPR